MAPYHLSRWRTGRGYTAPKKKYSKQAPEFGQSKIAPSLGGHPPGFRFQRLLTTMRT